MSLAVCLLNLIMPVQKFELGGDGADAVFLQVGGGEEFVGEHGHGRREGTQVIAMKYRIACNICH